MREANRLPSTPAANATTTRRSFLSQAAGAATGGAALALAPISPHAALAESAASPVPALRRALPDIFPEMKPAAVALDDATERFREASAAYHEIDEGLEQWGLDHPYPRRLAAQKKWVAWAKKVRDQSGVREALDEMNNARKALHQALIAVAKVAPRDAEQLALKASLAFAYEDGPKPGDRQPPIVSHAVVIDAVRLAGMLD